jgi:hypothetical protein
MTPQRQAGSGERQPESPKSSPKEADAVSLLEIDIGNGGVAPGLQSAESSRPVENKFGNHTDTFREIGRHKGKEIKHTREISDIGTREVRGQIIGYVPIQVVNLSLEEITLSKHMCVGIASPTETCVGDGPEKVHIVNKSKGHGDEDRSEQDFESYLSRKLEHMAERDENCLRPVLRKYRHLFYQEGSTAIGCTSRIQHKIDTGDALPIKKSPYRIPHALKPVVVEHIDDMLNKGIIEPSISPWSSSIVLVRKKTPDGTFKYRFCIDYRSLNAVTKPDAYPIPNIVDTLDSLWNSKIFSVLDMASGYHQIGIQEEDKEKTGFSCHRGGTRAKIGKNISEIGTGQF